MGTQQGAENAKRLERRFTWMEIIFEDCFACARNDRQLIPVVFILLGIERYAIKRC